MKRNLKGEESEEGVGEELRGGACRRIRGEESIGGGEVRRVREG